MLTDINAPALALMLLLWGWVVGRLLIPWARWKVGVIDDFDAESEEETDGHGDGQAGDRG